mmetsp:Transcript_32388/g.76185  ORF Transcript_32388/g.76185 Transcript_32388/m.76185 type:complete len:271 (+) Transcript_32388:1192-2004(+)
MVVFHLGWPDVVGPPHLHDQFLVQSQFFVGLVFVIPLEGSIVPFVQSPRFRDRDPVLIGRVQRHVAGERGALENGRKGLIDLDSVLEQEPPGCPGLLLSLGRQRHVAPSRVLVEFVPFRLAVAQQDQRVDAVLSEIGQLKGRGSRIQGSPTADDVADHGILVVAIVVVVAALHVWPPSSRSFAPRRSSDHHRATRFLGSAAAAATAATTVVVVINAVVILVVAKGSSRCRCRRRRRRRSSSSRLRSQESRDVMIRSNNGNRNIGNQTDHC